MLEYTSIIQLKLNSNAFDFTHLSQNAEWKSTGKLNILLFYRKDKVNKHVNFYIYLTKWSTQY